jgi:spore maturation protein SpmB
MATYNNTETNFNPALWADFIQENLYKQLVGMEVADVTLKKYLTNGTVVHVPILGQLTVTAYVKGTDVTVQTITTTDEYLMVDTQYEASVYLDDISIKQSKYALQEGVMKEQMYAIKNKLDAHILGQTILAADTLDAGDISGGGANGAAITLSTTNIIEAFEAARVKLVTAGVEENGDFVAVVTPAVASIIAQKAVGVGFNLAESTFKNGYAGDFDGFKIYVSNNLDVTTGTRKHIYIGKSKMISVVVQIAPTVRSDRDPLKFGTIVKVLSIWGVKTFYKNRLRFLDMQVN